MCGGGCLVPLIQLSDSGACYLPLSHLDVTVDDPTRVKVVQHTDKGVQHHLHGQALRETAPVLLHHIEEVAAIGILLQGT
jgi:hypothetical protein